MYDSAIVLWYCQLIWYPISINITECRPACMYVCETYWTSVLSLCLWLWLFLLISFTVISCHVMSYSVLHQFGETALIHAAREGHTETVTSLLDRGADINHKDNVSYCDACMIRLLHYGTFSWDDIWYQSISQSVDLHACMWDLLDFSAFSLLMTLTLTLSPHLI